MKFTFAPEARPLDGYTIKRAIHRGGFGEVYYALSDGGKEVALKLLNNNLEVELRGVSQCLNLKHRNLVTIFDIRQDSDTDHWVVMEYVSGRGLYETLRDYPNGMPVEEVLVWLQGIAAGLNFLHDRGIVHRDLKPANVFRDHDGVKIGDVGLSKYISESRRSAQTQSVGTVYYMAPEVARGRYGREVDIYALGVMLYEMLTGNVPFEGQTTAEILMKHLTGEPDLSVLPEKIRPVVASALEKDPDQRLASSIELEQRFRDAVSGINVKARVPLLESTSGASNHAAESFADTVPPASSPSQSMHDHVSTPAGGSSDTLFGNRENVSAGQAEPHAGRFAGRRHAQRATASASGLAAVTAWWNAMPAPLQWVIGGAAALFIIESGMLRTVAVGGMVGGAAYLGYQIVNAIVFEAGGKTGREHKPVFSRRQRSSPPPDIPAELAETQVDTTTPQPANKRRTPKSKKTKRAAKLTPATRRIISGGERATDIATSVSVSLIAALLVTTAVFLTTDLLNNVTQAVYFGTTTMLASWALIVPSKLWEGRTGDPFARRLCLGVMGLGIGYVAAVLSSYLLIDADSLFRAAPAGKPALIGRVILSDGTGYPTIACFMIYFGALFGIRRWWWQADSFRKSRFRVSSALFTLLVGVVVTGFLEDYSFPDTLGATWALAISAVVQLSAGWTPVEDRYPRSANVPDFTLDETTVTERPPVTGQQPAGVHQS